MQIAAKNGLYHRAVFGMEQKLVRFDSVVKSKCFYQKKKNNNNVHFIAHASGLRLLKQAWDFYFFIVSDFSMKKKTPLRYGPSPSPDAVNSNRNIHFVLRFLTHTTRTPLNIFLKTQTPMCCCCSCYYIYFERRREKK